MKLLSKPHPRARSTSSPRSSFAWCSRSSHGTMVRPGSPASKRAFRTASNFAGNDPGGAVPGLLVGLVDEQVGEGAEEPAGAELENRLGQHHSPPGEGS